jgi:hypothetical protein
MISENQKFIKFTIFSKNGVNYISWCTGIVEVKSTFWAHYFVFNTYRNLYSLAILVRI